MTKSGDPPGREPPGRYFAAPPPPTDDEAEGMEWGKQLAQKYMPQTAKLAAAVAFGDSNATAWTRLQAARLLAQIAGIPETRPETPQPGGDGGAHA